MCPRAVNQLFNEVNSRVELEFKISCSYMEIYNEKIFDLLSDMVPADQVTDYTIAEEKDGRGTFVRGIAEVEVKDENSTLNLLFSGGLSRTVATHKLNKQSNRSHSIFTIYLQQRQRSGVSERVVHSKLHLVDLAGSERLKKTMDSLDGTMGDEVTRKESMAINRSLTYLEQCVVALARRGQSHIPYRQSKLTNVLKDCLGANCNTIMIACMWGEANHLEESVSTLRLASRMMRVQNETVSVETVDPSTLIKKQEKIIRALKQELLMHDALVQRTGIAYEPYTPEQQESIAQMIERYIAASEVEEENVLSITNYRQMLEICKQFKKKVTTARLDTKAAQEQAFLASSGVGRTPSRGGPTGEVAFATTTSTQERNDFVADKKLANTFDPNAPTVGETIGGNAGGFALGIAVSDSRPLNGIERGPSRFTQSNLLAGSKTSPPGSPQSNLSPRSKFNFSPSNSPTRSSKFDFGDSQLGLSTKSMAVFEVFVKTDDGSELFKEFSDFKAFAKLQRTKSLEFASAVNEAKSLIDQLQGDIDKRKASRLEFLRSSAKASSKDEIVDEEEFRLTRELKEAKRSYRNSFEQMQKFKKESLDAQARSDQLKIELGRAFNRWSSGESKDTDAKTSSSPVNKFDELDDQEAFDKMEVDRILSNDPESLAFFNAQKTRRANITQNGGTLRQLQKNKRFS